MVLGGKFRRGDLLSPLGGHDKNKNKSRRKEEETKSAEDIK